MEGATLEATNIASYHQIHMTDPSLTEATFVHGARYVNPVLLVFVWKFSLSTIR